MRIFYLFAAFVATLFVGCSSGDSQYNNKYEVVNTTMCKLGASVPFEYVD